MHQVEMPELFQPSPLSRCSSKIPGCSFTSTGPSLWPIIHRLSPSLFPTLITSGVLVKAQESRKPVIRNLRKKKSPLEHLLYIVNVKISFIHLKIFLFSLLGKVIQKYGYVTGGGRRRRFSSLSVRFGNFFFADLRVGAILLFVNCAPIPKMVPHSLNEQKCIGELVRGRARELESVGGGAETTAPLRPASRSPFPLRVLLPCNSVLHKTKNKQTKKAHFFT